MKVLNSLFCAIALAGTLLGTRALASEYGAADDVFPDAQQVAYSSKPPIGNSSDQGTAQQACCGMSLTTEQLEKLSALKDSFLDGIDPKVVQIKSLKRQLLSETTKQSPDRAKALQIQSQINSIKSDIANARVNYGLDKLALMTPDQQEMARRRMLLKHVFGRFHHHGPGMEHRDGLRGGGNFKAEAPPEPVEEVSGLF